MNNYRKAIIMPLALSGILYTGNSYAEKVEIGGEKFEIEDAPSESAETPTSELPATPEEITAEPEASVTPIKKTPSLKPAKKIKSRSTSPFIDSYLIAAEARFAPGSYEAKSKAQSGASFLPAKSTGSQSVLDSRVTPGVRFLRYNELSLPVEIRSISALLENEIETVGNIGKSEVSESDLSFGAQYKRIFPWNNINFSAKAGVGYRKSSSDRKGPHDILFIEQNENASGLEYSVGARIATEKVIFDILYKKAAMSGEAKSEVSIPSFNLTLPATASNYERESGLLRLEALLNLHKWAKFTGRVEFEDLLRTYKNTPVDETSDERLKRIELGWLSPEFKGFSAGVYGGLSNSSGFSSAKKSDETSNSTYGGLVLTYHIDTGRTTSTGLSQNAAELGTTVSIASSTAFGTSLAPTAITSTVSAGSTAKPAIKKPAVRKVPAKKTAPKKSKK